MWRLRALTEDDVAAAAGIFNHYVTTSPAAYAQHPLTVEAFRSILPSGDRTRSLVAEDADGVVVGFAFLRPYSLHDTFAATAMATYFVAPDHTRRGLGSMLLDALEAQAKRAGIQHVLAHVASENEASLTFHRTHGFRQCGTFHDIGCKHGRSFDVVWFEKQLAPDS
jgi:phosphinothricin acetyltransferase